VFCVTEGNAVCAACLRLLLLSIAVQALVDVAAQGGCLASALAVMELVQSLVQVRKPDKDATLLLSLYSRAAQKRLGQGLFGDHTAITCGAVQSQLGLHNLRAGNRASSQLQQHLCE
jgi:hypothetical protein